MNKINKENTNKKQPIILLDEFEKDQEIDIEQEHFEIPVEPECYCIDPEPEEPDPTEPEIFPEDEEPGCGFIDDGCCEGPNDFTTCDECGMDYEEEHDCPGGKEPEEPEIDEEIEIIE